MEERVQRAVERLTIFRAVRMVAFVALTLALVAAVLERLVDPAMGDFADALWWAIVTVTTVGYGDVIPTSTSGRVIASFLMVAGVSAIPITTSLVVSVFVSRAQAQQRAHDAELRAELMARLERIEQALAARADT
jgi:voltage-gated potassium channel